MDFDATVRFDHQLLAVEQEHAVPGYWICWESFGEPVAVDPNAVAANPFAE